MSLKNLTVVLASSTFLMAETLPTLTISADPKGTDATEITSSVEVLDAKSINDRSAKHFGDLITQIANLNYSGESSRAKFIQIRGMGERSQYTRSPDTSVGFMIDGIDFSGIGMGANLFDVKQVEVLRGSQSTRFGASALAGLINIETNDPENTRNSHAEATLATYNQFGAGVATTGSFGRDALSPQYRFVVHKQNSDGSYHNKTLDKKNTNDLDELTARAKLRFFVGEDWQADLTAMHINLDNGYDKWAGDNSFDTHSNTPGEDKQKTNAGSLKLSYDDEFKFTSLTSYQKSDLYNSYDGDWEATGDDFYFSDRDRKNIAQEFRLAKNLENFEWILGVYKSRLDEKSVIDETWGGDNSITKTDYQLDKTAVFGQLDTHLSDQLTLVTALRVEQIDSQFDHSDGNSFSPDETLWGGEIALKYKQDSANNYYASIKRGFKAGGFNAGVGVSDRSKLEYKSESAINYEIGHKHKSTDLSINTAIFYIDRVDAQFNGSEQKPGKSEFRFYTANFGGAYNYGLESELDYQATDQLNIFATLGLLKTSFKRAASELATIEPRKREQAHAPNYQYMTGAQVAFARGFVARAEVQGMDKFYFSNSSHDQKSKAHNLANLKLGYESKSWDLYLWCKNIFDEKYATRGFFFDRYDGSGNKLYTALGDPRVVGVTARARF